MKTAVCLFVALCVALAFSAPAFSASPPDKVTLNQGGKKGPVHFNHKAHVLRAASCKECHHKDNPGAEQKCSVCHKDKMSGNVVSLKEAFHGACKDCHKKKGGPTKCDGCHKK